MNLEVTDDMITSHQLGVGVYSSAGFNDGSAKAESAIAFRKGYYR